jgi:hypothetical protein
MHLTELYRLERAGGAVWQRYQELVAAADASLHDSPAQRALGEFQQAWAADPAGVTAALAAQVQAPVGAAEVAEEAVAADAAAQEQGTEV